MPHNVVTLRPTYPIGQTFIALKKNSAPHTWGIVNAVTHFNVSTTQLSTVAAHRLHENRRTIACGFWGGGCLLLIPYEMPISFSAAQGIVRQINMNRDECK